MIFVEGGLYRWPESSASVGWSEPRAGREGGCAADRWPYMQTGNRRARLGRLASDAAIRALTVKSEVAPYARAVCRPPPLHRGDAGPASSLHPCPPKFIRFRRRRAEQGIALWRPEKVPAIRLCGSGRPFSSLSGNKMLRSPCEYFLGVGRPPLMGCNLVTKYASSPR